MNMDTLTYVAIGAALSQAVLTAVLLSAGHLTSLSRRLYGLLLIGVVGYLLIPLLNDWSGRWLLTPLATLVPGAFWLFSSSLFDDHYEFPLWQPLAVAASVVMPTIWYLAGALGGGWPEWILVGLPQLAEFAFLGMALYVIFRSWRDDLITTRRALRIWFCATLGVSIFAVLLAREVLFAGKPWLDVSQYIAAAIIATGMNVILLRFHPGILDPVQRGRPVKAPAPLADEQLDELVRLVEEEGIYREWGMSIGKLAMAADIPEYRLRQLINSGMGYRNFNDFLNRFRLAEAAGRLADPAQEKIPVLTIALESGFRSISTFNKTFKEMKGVTPTVFRKEQLSA